MDPVDPKRGDAGRARHNHAAMVPACQPASALEHCLRPNASRLLRHMHRKAHEDILQAKTQYFLNSIFYKVVELQTKYSEILKIFEIFERT